MRKSFAAALAILGAATMISCGTQKSESNTNSFKLYGSSSAGALTSRMGTLDCNEATPCAGSPTKLIAFIRHGYVSTNADCSNPIAIGQEDTSLNPDDDLSKGDDLVQNPLLLSGIVPPGTYRCLIIKMYDNFAFIPDATAQNDVGFGNSCKVGGTHGLNYDTTLNMYIQDIYRTDDATGWIDVAGATVTSRGTKADPRADLVTLFVSTAVSAEPVEGEEALINVNGTQHPSYNQILHLSAPIVVSETEGGSSTFVFDATNGLQGNTSENYCAVEGAQFLVR